MHIGWVQYFYIVDVNVSFFAAFGVIRGYNALNELTREAGLEYPERVTSTNLRKYFATLTQVINS